MQRSRTSRQRSPASAGQAWALPADAILLITVLLWSFNFTAVKYAVTHGFAPLTYAPLRWGIAGTAFAVVTWRREGSLRVSRRDLVLLIVLASVGVWLNQIAFVYASRLVTAATVALLFGTLPVFVTIFSHFAGVERFRLRHWLAVALSFLRCGARGRRGRWRDLCPRRRRAARARDRRDLRCLLGWRRPLLRRHSPYRINTITALAGAVLLATTGSVQLSEQDWSMGALAWEGSCTAHSRPRRSETASGSRASGRVGPGRAALYVNLQPFLGALFATIVLSESLDRFQVVGGIIVGAAILVARAAPDGRPARRVAGWSETSS